LLPFPDDYAPRDAVSTTTPAPTPAVEDSQHKRTRLDFEKEPTSFALVELLDNAYPGQMPRLVKRYARSRLYDTEAACYVTLTDLQAWVLAKVPFIVIDVETGADVTRVLLA
jgi:hypothetical protein